MPRRLALVPWGLTEPNQSRRGRSCKTSGTPCGPRHTQTGTTRRPPPGNSAAMCARRGSASQARRGGRQRTRRNTRRGGRGSRKRPEREGEGVPWGRPKVASLPPGWGLRLHGCSSVGTPRDPPPRAHGRQADCPARIPLGAPSWGLRCALRCRWLSLAPRERESEEKAPEGVPCRADVPRATTGPPLQGTKRRAEGEAFDWRLAAFVLTSPLPPYLPTCGTCRLLLYDDVACRRPHTRRAGHDGLHFLAAVVVHLVETEGVPVYFRVWLTRRCSSRAAPAVSCRPAGG
jgi:hypothetical protein